MKRKFSRDAEWLLLDSDTLFVCGGKALSHGGDPLTFYFTFSTGSLVRKVNMLFPRFWHAIHALDNEVYAWGGNDL